MSILGLVVDHTLQSVNRRRASVPPAPLSNSTTNTTADSMATWTVRGTVALQSTLCTLCRQLEAAAAHSAAAAAVAGVHTTQYHYYQQQQQQQLQPQPVAVTAQLLLTLCSELYSGQCGMLHASSGSIDSSFAAVPTSTATTATAVDAQQTAPKQTIEPQRIQMYRNLGVIMGASLRSRVSLPLRLSAELWQQLADGLCRGTTGSGSDSDSSDTSVHADCVEATAIYSGIISQVSYVVLYACNALYLFDNRLLSAHVTFSAKQRYIRSAQHSYYRCEAESIALTDTY
jgi:hypothetical protein